MADKSMSAADLAAKLHSANARVVTAYQHTSGHDAAMNLADASALIKEVISVLMEGETDYYGNRVEGTLLPDERDTGPRFTM